jgi:predicted metal-dependent phosphoesterase TrpH
MAADQAARIRIDMHLHTRRSFDSLNDPDAVLRTARERGLHRICVTDHNQIATALELKRRFPEHVIVGEEVKTAEGVDVIGLYISEVIPRGTPALEACRRIHDQGGIVYVPHPYAAGKGGDGRLLADLAGHVDAIEGFNARIHDPALNERAVQWGREHDIPIGAGSDAHTLLEIGRAYVEVPAFEDSPAGLLHALRAGTIHGVASSRAVHLASTYAKVRKLLPGA